MNRGLQGYYIPISTTGEKVRAFVPTPLPPVPAIDWSPKLREKFDQAHLALGRLDSVSVLLPDTGIFLYMYIRQEAVLSSMIEGTQSSLSDLLMFESGNLPTVPLVDVEEVSNYVAALNYGLLRLKEGFPLSLRLIKEIHGVLLAKGRGHACVPGEFRCSQNWIGGNRPGNAAFVPPPAVDVQNCMGALEKFLHNQPEKTPALLKVTLAHVQFETIHPFLDGNGRLGRLLITLLLWVENVLREPLLYLSLYFKVHRERYYELLTEVRLTGDWESWLVFFAEAVQHTATEAVSTAQKLMDLGAGDRAHISSQISPSGSVLRVYQVFGERPMASPQLVQEKTELSPATVNSCLRELERLGIITELTGRKRNRVYGYMKYFQIMNEGIELPRQSTD